MKFLGFEFGSQLPKKDQKRELEVTQTERVIEQYRQSNDRWRNRLKKEVAEQNERVLNVMKQAMEIIKEE